MDESRLDRIARVVGACTDRRGFTRILTVLIAGGVTASTGVGSSEASKSGKCKPACGACATCQPGKCKRKHGKKKCKPGTCTVLPNGTVCNGSGQCLNGTCNAQPTCLGTGQPCTAGQVNSCCSGVCRGDDHCQNSGNGQPCLQTSDCITPAKCIGFVCQGA